MTDPDPVAIYLQPACCADDAVGRLWCEDDAPVECEDGVPWTKYVRADEIERLRAERDALLTLIVDILPFAEDEWGDYQEKWHTVGGALLKRMRAAIDAAKEQSR